MWKITRLLSILFVLLVSATKMSAQTIEVKMPSDEWSEYTFSLVKGTQQDIVVSGSLNMLGQASFVLPSEYTKYRGVGKFWVKDTNKHMNIIINGEDRIVFQEQDSSEVIVFSHSKENIFIGEMISKQSQIAEKYGYIQAGLTVYQESDLFYPNLKKESILLKEQYISLREEVIKSPLYAARLVEILNYLSSAGSLPGMSPEDVISEQLDFISQQLDFEDLYTSGFWQMTMDSWYQITSASDSLLLTNSRKILDRVTDIPIRRELTQSIIRLFSKYGKDSLLLELGTEYLTMPINGQIAPNIKIGDSSFLPQNSLILFYETGCGNCHNELEELKNSYSLLSENKVRVISITADMDQDVFKTTAEKLPWEDKFCDFKGFDGENFQNYGIVGTPTYILTDQQGIVRGRYARLKELIKMTD